MSIVESKPALVTADELHRISSQLSMQGKTCELIEGELRIMAPPGSEHGYLAMELGGLIREHARKHGLGVCFAAETGFLIQRDPDTVRAPDVSFITQERFKAVGIPQKYFPEAPALAVEVVSPSDRADDVQEKAKSWIEAGCQSVWLVWPGNQTVTVYHSLEKIRVLTNDETLEDPTLPGFRLSLAELFDYQR